MNDAILDDGSLLKQFSERRDESSFEVFVNRHGALVFGVCCRVLGQTQEAEDATQAVFLTLANKAKTLQGNRSVVAWLHGVAYNISLRAREAAAGRRNRERVAGRGIGNESVEIYVRGGPDWESIKPLLNRSSSPCPKNIKSP